MRKLCAFCVVVHKVHRFVKFSLIKTRSVSLKESLKFSFTLNHTAKKRNSITLINWEEPQMERCAERY